MPQSVGSGLLGVQEAIQPQKLVPSEACRHGDCRACPPLSFSVPSLAQVLILLWLPLSLAPSERCQLDIEKKGYRKGRRNVCG